MNKIVTSMITREEFLNEILPNNQGLVILKFGATWCRPCQLCKDQVYSYFNLTSDNVTCYDVDVDDSFDLYAFLKSKRMINGIPVILAYKKGNETFAPDLSVTGANTESITNFFNNCKNLL
jgi:thiol:disulfide interchange protein